MSKYHSTVSRREFMKGLGLAGAGLGAVAAAAPVFRDLDEVAASPQGVQEKLPWWIKQREYMDPTTKVDWALMERFDQDDYDNMLKHVKIETFEKRAADRQKMRIDYMSKNTPGFTRKDQALKVAGWLRPYASLKREFLGEGEARLYSPPERPEQSFGSYKFMPTNAPKYEGTAEENSKILRAAARFCGAAEVNFLEITPDKTKKLIFIHNLVPTGYEWMLKAKRFVFEDVDKPYEEKGETEDKCVIPNNCKYAIVYSVLYDWDLSKLAPSQLTDAMVGEAYDKSDIIRYRLQAFVQCLGYNCAGQDVLGMTIRPAFGVLAGLGELGRIHTVVTPKWGPSIRMTDVLLTDLPVVPSNPIDAGINRFCRTCRKCCDSCPNNAIDVEEEPRFERVSPDNSAGNPDHLQPELFNNSPGYERWPFNHYACNAYWFETDSACGICNAVCVFSKEKLASIHEFVKPVVATTTLFNGFFYNMDEAFGFGLYADLDKRNVDWWTEEKKIIAPSY